MGVARPRLASCEAFGQGPGQWSGTAGITPENAVGQAGGYLLGGFRRPTIRGHFPLSDSACSNFNARRAFSALCYMIIP